MNDFLPAPAAFVALVLHAHLPFVRHPEHADSLEERWLFEAVVETYLPLLEVLAGWRRDGVDFRLTLSLSPTLLAMLGDDLLRERIDARMDCLCELGGREVARASALGGEDGARVLDVARMYRDRHDRLRQLWRREIAGGLPAAFGRYAKTNNADGAVGRLELITCGATHAFLPLWSMDAATTRAQIEVAAEAFKRAVGARPTGFWSPECGYYPGLERFMGEAGLGYFFIDAHGALFASERPRDGVFAPLRLPNGVAAFPREVASARQVWSAEEGYPGDPRYREFYRDIGHDLPLEYVGPFIHASGLRVDTGFKYHRVTGRGAGLHEKEIYDPVDAEAAAAEHAADFMRRRLRQAAKLRGLMSKPPLITAPYDAELFGHWWFEGPMFLDKLMRLMTAETPGEAAGEAPGETSVESCRLRPITPSEYLERYPDLQVATPAFSSWGQGGYAGVWQNERNEWIQRETERVLALARGAARRITTAGSAGTGATGTTSDEIAARPNPDPLTRRALTQIAREIMLAQSSDWAFILHQGTSAQYAEARARGHLVAAEALTQQVEANAVKEEGLAELEARDNLFHWLRWEPLLLEPELWSGLIS